MNNGWFYTFVRTLLRFVFTVFLHARAFGYKKVPKKGGVLIVANHQSYLDPVFVALYVRRPMSFLAKSELFENPIFSKIITELNAFPIRQGEGDVGAVKETIRRLQEGHLLTVFPEGARCFDGELQPIAGGVAIVIRRAKVPVVPCVLDGPFDAWSRTTPLPKTAPIDIVFGDPMDMSDMGSKEIISTIDETFKKMMADLRARRHAEGRDKHYQPGM